MKTINQIIKQKQIQHNKLTVKIEALNKKIGDFKKMIEIFNDDVYDENFDKYYLSVSDIEKIDENIHTLVRNFITEIKNDWDEWDGYEVPWFLVSDLKTSFFKEVNKEIEEVKYSLIKNKSALENLTKQKIAL